MKQPNIVVIFGDDIGYGDFGCYNPESKIPTPNIDALAKTSICFTDAHSSSAVCTPSRYGLLTGQHCFRSKLKRSVLCGYEPPLIEKGRETLASMLHDEGYYTACIGKWHVGMGFHTKEGQILDFNRPLPWGPAVRAFEEKIDLTKPMFGGPTDLGFDTFFGSVGCPTCQSPYAFVRDNEFTNKEFYYLACNTDQMRSGLAATDWDNRAADPTFLQEAVTIIEETAKTDKPLFMYLCPSAAHEPCTEEDTPEIALGKSEAGYRGDLVWLFDHMVGGVVDALKKSGAWENTILLISSDNGALPGDRMPVTDPSQTFNFETYGHKANGDWRGYKSHIWEGGHREPLLVSWPAKIKEGASCDGLVCLTDLFATFQELTHAPAKPTGGEDSVSFLHMLQDPAAPSKRDHAIHHSQTGVFSLRQGDWKLIFECESSGGWPPPTDRRSPVQGADGQLYNLKDDPYETTNLYHSHPDLVAALSARLMTLKDRARSI